MSIMRLSGNLSPQAAGSADTEHAGSSESLVNENEFLAPSAHHESWVTLENGPNTLPAIPACTSAPDLTPPYSERLRG